MMSRRQPILTRLALLFALLFLGTNAPASPWLWQCRHARQVVGVSFHAAPSAMPCRMMAAMKTGGPMSCCVKHRAVSAPPAPGDAVTRPPCAPTLQRIALSIARLASADLGLRSAMMAPVPFTSLPWAGLFPTPLRAVQRPRPPPGGLPPATDRRLTPGLRAPPTA